MNRTIACVTGATGMVGSRIVEMLLREGYSVRVLSRREDAGGSRVHHYKGDLANDGMLQAFVSGAQLLFHCAAELNDVSRMRDVNMRGTERLIQAVRKSPIAYFCFISSAGVIGRTKKQWIDEETECNPQNEYEKSKWEAEQLVRACSAGCRVIVLRPTNVMDEKRPGPFSLPMRATWRDKLILFLKGAECAHVLHAEDVAEAALFGVSQPDETGPQVYFVSRDEDPVNTYADIWALFKSVTESRPIDAFRPFHLPLFFPYLLRMVWRGKGNRGDVRFSSKKLIERGFRFPLSLEEISRNIATSASGNANR